MASAIKKCRVCGKEYEACRSANTVVGVFRWQEVACSPECGMIYLQQVNESRGVSEPQKKNKQKKRTELIENVTADAVEPGAIAADSVETTIEEYFQETEEPTDER